MFILGVHVRFLPNLKMIQKRTSGAVDFYRTYSDYQGYFGDQDNYWIGLNALNSLTSHRPQELYVWLQGHDLRSHYAKYGTFYVGPESDGYRLNVTGYTGNASKEILMI